MVRTKTTAGGAWRALLPPVLAGWVALGGAPDAQAQPAGDVTPPVVQQGPAPSYPEAALFSGVSGHVVVAVVVSAEGRVVQAAVEGGLGPPFAAVALDAVKRWRFEPARVGGQPRAARVLVEVPFPSPLGASGQAPPPSTAGEPGAAAEREEPGETRRPAALAPTTTEAEAGAADGTSEDARVDEPHQPQTREDAPAAGAHEEVTVRGRRREARRGASDHRIHVGALRSVPRQGAVQLLELAPGVLTTGDAAPGQAEQVYLRGFDARLGQDLEFSVEGVPVNQVGNLNGNGYADLSFIIPEVVSELRVVEGPFAPRQGNFAVAGSADYRLGLERRGVTLVVGRGSYGAERLTVLWGPPSSAQATFGAASVARADGVGDNRGHQQGQAMGQFVAEAAGGATWTLRAGAAASSAEVPGVLRADDYEAGRVGFFDSYDSWQQTEAQRFDISGELRQARGAFAQSLLVFATRHGGRTRENYTGALLDPQEAFQQPHQQRGDRVERAFDGLTLGSRGSVAWQAPWRKLTQALEVGYLARGDFFDAEQFRVQTSNDIPYQRDVDLGGRVANVALYADAGLRPTSWLSLRGGVRADSYFYDLVDRCASTTLRFLDASTNGDASCHSQQPEGDYRDPTQRIGSNAVLVLPRAVLALGPFHHFLFSLAAGQGARAIDPVFVNAQTAAPVASLSAYEAGVQYVHGFRASEMTLSSVFFQTTVERDLIFSQTEGRNTLASGTTRTGWAGALRWNGAWFDTNDTVTLVRATFDDTHLLIPYVPPLVVRSDSALHHDLPLAFDDAPLHGALAAGATLVGARPLQYGEWSQPLFTLDASASLQWTAFEFQLAVENLLDARYRAAEYNYASDFGSQPGTTLLPARHFTAGAPRTFMATLSARFGGES